MLVLILTVSDSITMKKYKKKKTNEVISDSLSSGIGGAKEKENFFSNANGMKKLRVECMNKSVSNVVKVNTLDNCSKNSESTSFRMEKIAKESLVKNYEHKIKEKNLDMVPNLRRGKDSALFEDLFREVNTYTSQEVRFAFDSIGQKMKQKQKEFLIKFEETDMKVHDLYVLIGKLSKKT